MYEGTSYEQILKRMMERVPAGIDKREGSIIYDALAPAAVELQNMYIELEWLLDQVFADTAIREYLVKRCGEQGITPYPAVKAVLKGEFNIDIAVGSRFSCDLQNYKAVEKISPGVYKMECETAGVAGNRNLGDMIPITYIPGLTSAKLTEVLDDGAEEESTEALRQRYLAKVRKPSTSGNRHDYYNWAMECAGVGAAKVFPLAEGPGTVRVVIADANRSAAGDSLVQQVREHIEPKRPIGADVTVVSAAEKAVNVSARIKLKNGLNLGTVQDLFTQSLTGYLQENAFDIQYVSTAKIGNLLLNVAGVEDFSELLLNGLSENIPLSEEEIAVAGTVSLEVM